MMQQYLKLVQTGAAVWWPLCFAVLLWLGLYWETLWITIHIWSVSEIFSHGFFVLPGVLYLVWRERRALFYDRIRPDYRLLLVVLPVLLLGVFGRIGGIQIFAQFSAFAFLPLAAWMLLGHRVARQLWFPLLFMLFAIPVGEELVPTLQVLTARLAMEMLSWTSLPIYQSGLYIEIPQGKFVVAEACSGIRFFIGSLVFGAIYSHLSYRVFWRKCAFMVLAAVVPIVANAVRVFGIVLIGYYSDMEYATGADHLIYGWVFFAIVLVVLVLLGELFKQKTEIEEIHGDDADHAPFIARMRRPLWMVVACLLVANVWAWSIEVRDAHSEQGIDDSALTAVASPQAVTDWQPEFKGAAQTYRGQLLALSGGQRVDVLLAYAPEDREGRELVSSQNNWYRKDKWHFANEMTTETTLDAETLPVRVLTIQASNNIYRSIAYVYVLPAGYFNSPIRAKLAQTLDRVLGGSGEGAVVALSIRHRDADFDARAQELAELLSTNASRLQAALPESLRLQER